MSEQVITTPVRFRPRTTVIVLGLVAALAIAVGAVVSSVGSGGGSEPLVQRAAPAVPVPPTLQLCGNDPTNLLAAIATMPATVQAHVMGTLSPVLSDALDHVALNVDPAALTVPDDATLGTIMTRLSRADRDAIINALPAERAAAVMASWKSNNVREFLSNTAAPCS